MPQFKQKPLEISSLSERYKRRYLNGSPEPIELDKAIPIKPAPGKKPGRI